MFSPEFHGEGYICDKLCLSYPNDLFIVNVMSFFYALYLVALRVVVVIKYLHSQII